MRDIVFFTCATRAYERFAPLYAASVLHHLDTAAVEFGLEDVAAFRRDNPAVALVESRFPDRLRLRDVPWSEPARPVAPNSVRFLHQPLTRATWTYVGDVDIVFLDRWFFERHLPFMARTGLPYSNAVRPGTRRLSGLHLVRSDAWYPLPSTEGFDLTHDEALLYALCERKGLPVQDGEWFRPQHGVHVSPNRTLEGWGVRNWRHPFRRFAETPLFQALRPALHPELQAALDQIEDATQRPPVLADVAARLASEPALASGRDYAERRRTLAAAKDHAGLAALGLKRLDGAPADADVHRHTARALGALHLFDEAVDHAARAEALAPERADLREETRRWRAALRGVDAGWADLAVSEGADP